MSTFISAEQIDAEIVRLLGIKAAHWPEACDSMLESYQTENTRLRAALTQTRAALAAASDHLDYCGYGDSWERECAKAEGLKPKIAAALVSADEALK